MEHWGLTNPSGPRQVAADLAGAGPEHPSKLQMMLESSKGLQPVSPDGRQIRYVQISSPENTRSVQKRNRPMNRALEMMEGGAAVLCGVALAQVCERRHRARSKRAGFRSRSASKLSRRVYNSQPGTPKKDEPWELLGVPLTADFTAVGLAYFAQGALALAALAKPFYVKDTLGMSPADSSLFLSFTYWPWIMKPLWGFVADSIPIFGSRRQAYLVLAGAISVVGWLGLAGWWPVEVSKEATLVFMVMGNFGIAFSDVVVDGLVVEKARDDPRLMGGLQSFSWACRGFGAILSAYFSGALLEMIGVQQVFAVTALLPLLVIVAAVLIREPAQPAASSNALDWDEARQLGQQVWEVIRAPEVFPAVLFILAWQATPTAGSATFYFYTNELHFNPEFLGRSQLVGSLASLGGIVLYNRVFSSVPIKDYLSRIQVTAVTLGFLPILLATRANLALNIPDQMFVLGDDVIQTVAGELAHMPILVLAAQLCPRGIEATLFALLMSALNAASFLSSTLGAYLTHVLEVTDSDFSNYAFLLLICNLSGLLPLALLPGIRSQPSNKRSN